MATPLDPCDSCGRPFSTVGAGLRVRIRVGFSPGTHDLDAEELAAEDVPEWLVALFDTTDGIGAAAMELCQECISGAVDVADREVEWMKSRSARKRKAERRRKRR